MGRSAATIVLVHGAWADGSSWNKVISLLQTKDLPVIAVQIPLTSLEDDLAATSRMAILGSGSRRERDQPPPLPPLVSCTQSGHRRY